MLDAAVAARLAVHLAALEVDRRRGYRGGVARWLDDEVLPALGAPPEDGAGREASLIDALAGAGSASEAGMPRFIEWEGHPYRVDLVAAEADRLRRVRERQGGPSLDTSLAVARAARLDARATLDEVRAAEAGLTRAADDVPDEAVAAAVATGLDPRSAVRRVAAGLAVVRAPGDLGTVAARRRAARGRGRRCCWARR